MEDKLIEYIKNDNINGITQLIKDGVDVNFEDGYPLCKCIEYGK